jgi:phosphoesterase RecJ-like protein
MSSIETLAGWLSLPRKLTLITHERPDGDAIGSTLGLYHFLKAKGHSVTAIAPSPFAGFLSWIPGSEEMLVGPKDRKAGDEALKNADFVFCIDFNELRRVGEFEEALTETKAPRILLDHHLLPQDAYALRFWDSSASSAAEMVYRLIRDLGGRELISPAIANALYTGIMTDTGSFRFSSTTPAVHRIVAELVEKGVNIPEVHSNIYENALENRLRFLGHCLVNCLYVLPEYNTAYILAEKADIHKFDLNPGDMEGVVNYTLAIKGIQLGVLITEQQGLVKMSFRSKGKFPANEFAGHFGGGGHFNAAGGRSRKPIREVEKRFLLLLEDYKEKLTT